jgi:ubiquinone biosynthesis protein Coq4
MPPDIDLFRARMRELHDVSHVVSGYGRDSLGE